MADSKGKPTKEQVLREAFDMTDIEGKKWIPPAKIGSALRSVGKRLTDEQVEKFKKQAEEKNEGKVDFDAFKLLVEEASKIEKTENDIEYAFKVFSKDSKDGKESPAIPVATLKQYLTTLGDKLTERQVNEFLAQADVTGPGFQQTITLAAFMKVIQSSTLASLPD